MEKMAKELAYLFMYLCISNTPTYEENVTGGGKILYINKSSSFVSRKSPFDPKELVLL